MSDMVLLILGTSIYIPFWIFVTFSVISILKTIFDHVKEFDNPLKLKTGFTIAFRTSIIFFVCYFCLTFFIYYANQLLGFMPYKKIPYFTGFISFLITAYAYYKMIIAFGKKGGFIDTLKSISNLWK